MATGTVKVFSPSRGSGWIRPDSGGNLVYVHKSGIARQEEGRAPSLEKGQRVEFQIGQRPKGPAAINVRPAATAEAAAPAEVAADVTAGAAEPSAAAETEAAAEA